MILLQFWQISALDLESINVKCLFYKYNVLDFFYRCFLFGETRCFPLQSRRIKVKWSRYRPGVAQRVGRGIALLFHDRGTRRGWVVSSTSRPHFTPGKDLVPILQEAVWAPGPVRTGGKSRPHRDSIPDRPARSSVAIPTELSGPPSRRKRKRMLQIWRRKGKCRADLWLRASQWEAVSLKIVCCLWGEGRMYLPFLSQIVLLPWRWKLLVLPKPY